MDLRSKVDESDSGIGECDIANLAKAQKDSAADSEPYQHNIQGQQR